SAVARVSRSVVTNGSTRPSLHAPEDFGLTRLGLKTLAGATTVNDQRLIAAGAMAALLPMMLLFFALQRFFFKGVGEGAVKL
ncbi:hypothetical protein ACWF7Q_31715, partial [Streptomyces sp. NPDC054987]